MMWGSILPQTDPKSIDLESESSFPALSTAPKMTPLTLTKSTTVTVSLEIPYENQAKSQLGKVSSVSEQCRNVMSKYRVSIESCSNRKNGLLTCLISGKPEAVADARHELLRLLTLEVKLEVPIPAAVRPHLVGKKGVNLKALMAKTFTNIQLPLRNDSAENDQEETLVTITGHSEAVAMAKQEILELIASRAAKYSEKLTVESEYVPFLSGQPLEKLEKDLGVRLHLAPVDPNSKVVELLVVGEQENVVAAKSRFLEFYNHLKKTTRTISIPVRKKQHRFIVGPKGSAVQEIFAKTGCFVEVPPQADPSDTVNVKGPESMLSVALQLVLEKANSVLIDEINVTSLLPSSMDTTLFMRYFYAKARASLKAIETEFEVNIYQQTIEQTTLFEVQAKSRTCLENSTLKLSTLVRDIGKSLFIGLVDIPNGLHKFVVGKGGQNIVKLKAKPEWETRLVDIVFFPESDESDDVLIIVKRGSSKSLVDNDKESLALVELIKTAILSDAQQLADLTTQVINVDPKYHSRLIGAGGSALKEILAPFEKTVSVKFGSSPNNSPVSSTLPSKPSDPSEIRIRGMKKDVAKVAEDIVKIVSELKHIEIMTSFSEDVVIDSAYSSKLVGEDGHTARLVFWIVKNLREKYASKTLKLLPADKHFEKDLEGTAGMLYLTAELTRHGDTETISIKGPKSFVGPAKALVEHRYKELLDTEIQTFDVYDEICEQAKSMIKEELKSSILSRLIGKEGKSIKRLQERHGVFIKFGKDKRDEEESPVEQSEETKKITIKGGRLGVAATRAEIIEFVENIIMSSFVLSFRLPKNARPTLVGRAGSNLTEIKTRFDVRIDINDIEDNEDEIEIVLEGLEVNCVAIKKEMQDSVDDLVNAETRGIEVPAFLHRLVIGSGGSTIRKFIDELGGQDKVRVNTPKFGVNPASELNTISITANRKIMDTIVESFEKLIVQEITEFSSPGFPENVFKTVLKPDQGVSLTIELPRADLTFVLGRMAETAIGLMKKYGVTLWTDEYVSPDTDTVHVTIVSKEQTVLDKVKEFFSSKVRNAVAFPLPDDILVLLSEADQYHKDHRTYLQGLVKKVKSDNGTQVDLPIGLLKGQPGSTIQIRGETAKVEASEKQLARLLDEWQNKRFMVKIPILVEYRRHIIGRGGQTINRLKEESGATLDLIQSKSEKTEGDVLIIRGSTDEQVQTALKLVEKLIEEQSERVKRDQERAVQNERREKERESKEVKNVARIDDDVESKPHKTFGISGHVPPGYVGKNSHSSSSSSVKVASAVTVPFTNSHTTKASEPEQWKAVPSKKGKVEEVVVDKKKKNKKAKQTVVTPQSPIPASNVLSPIVPASKVLSPVVQPSKIVSPVVQSKVLSPIVPAAKITQPLVAQVAKPSIASQPISPQVISSQVVSKPSQPISPILPVENEWIQVPTRKSRQTSVEMPVEDVSKAKKKKQKKKKKQAEAEAEDIQVVPQ